MFNKLPLSKQDFKYISEYAINLLEIFEVKCHNFMKVDNVIVVLRFYKQSKLGFTF